MYWKDCFDIVRYIIYYIIILCAQDRWNSLQIPKFL